MEDKQNELLALAADNSKVRRLSRTYLYGWCRMNGHDRLAWLFASKRGRAFLRDLRHTKRAARR